MERLRQKQQILLSPKDYFNGKRLPEKFSAPDNILMFHHDFSSNREISHPRYTLVIPHGKMRYLIDSEEYSIQSGNALLISPVRCVILCRILNVIHACSSPLTCPKSRSISRWKIWENSVRTPLKHYAKPLTCTIPDKVFAALWS